MENLSDVADGYDGGFPDVEIEVVGIFCEDINNV
jgi:hypothetical protein